MESDRTLHVAFTLRYLIRLLTLATCEALFQISRVFFSLKIWVGNKVVINSVTAAYTLIALMLMGGFWARGINNEKAAKYEYFI